MMKKQIGVWVDAGEELYGVIVCANSDSMLNCWVAKNTY